MSLLSIIIVSYNTREMTLACIRSVFEQTSRHPFEVIVLDNNSSDESADAIHQAFADRITLVRSKENFGFARGNNEAIRGARGDRLLLLNPDTLVLDGAIDRLLDFADSRPDARIWGGRTLYADRSLNPASCWRRQNLWTVFCLASGLASAFRGSRLFDAEAYGGWKRDSVRQVDIVSGCFLLIDAELWRKLEGFDPAFFMYGEEADLCLRAHAHGARPLITPDAMIIHYGGASEKVRSDKMVRLLTAKCLLIRRHWPAFRAALGVRMLAAWPLMRALAWSCAALFMGQRATLAAEQWWSVWGRRAQWMGVAGDSSPVGKTSRA